MYQPTDCSTEKFTNLLTELKIKLIEIKNPMPNIILTGELNFPIIKWQLEGRTHESQVQAKCLPAFHTGPMFTSIYRGDKKKIQYSRCLSD